jgi:hypothetical protein
MQSQGMEHSQQQPQYRKLKERRVQLLAETHAVLSIMYWVPAAMPRRPPHAM